MFSTELARSGSIFGILRTSGRARRKKGAFASPFTWSIACTKSAIAGIARSIPPSALPLNRKSASRYATPSFARSNADLGVAGSPPPSAVAGRIHAEHRLVLLHPRGDWVSGGTVAGLGPHRG